MMKNKNRRKYNNGDTVIVGGYKFVVIGYHYPSMQYIVRRSDGLETIVREDEFDTIHIPPIWK